MSCHVPSDPHGTEVKFDRVGDSSGRYNVLNLQRNRNDSSGKAYEFEIVGTYVHVSLPPDRSRSAQCPVPVTHCQSGPAPIRQHASSPAQLRPLSPHG